MNLHQIASIVLYKAYAEVKAEVSRTYLGLIWWIVEPILFMLTFYYLFSILFDRGGADFVASLIVGLVVWKWFGSSLQTGSSSIYANRDLIQQVYIPKVIFPLSVIVANTSKFLVVFLLLSIFLVVMDYPITYMWGHIFFIIIIQFFVISSITLFLSIFVSFLPDGKYLIDNFLVLLMFLSGVFFDISTLPSEYQDILYLNPMAIIIESYRDVLLHNITPDYVSLGSVVFYNFCLLCVALILHSKLDRVFPKVLR